MAKASAVEKTERPRSAVRDWAEGVSVHGWSTIRLAGTSRAAPEISDPAAGMIDRGP